MVLTNPHMKPRIEFIIMKIFMEIVKICPKSPRFTVLSFPLFLYIHGCNLHPFHFHFFLCIPNSTCLLSSSSNNSSSNSWRRRCRTSSCGSGGGGRRTMMQPRPRRMMMLPERRLEETRMHHSWLLSRARWMCIQ